MLSIVSLIGRVCISQYKCLSREFIISLAADNSVENLVHYLHVEYGICHTSTSNLIVQIRLLVINVYINL